MAFQHVISFTAVTFAISLSLGADAKGASAAADAKDACKQGRSQYAAGDVVKSIKTLSHCVEHEPRNREAWTALANANLESGKFAAAADAFAKAEGIKTGDDAFLTAYLSALEGAGRSEEQIPILRILASRKSSDRKDSERLLAAVEASGPDRHPDEYLFALQSLSEGPKADRYQVEKLAAAYLKRGQLEKAEAEYRGLLVKSPESGEDWAGLGAALAPADPQAAAECYRKAALYSSQAAQREGYVTEQQRLAKVTPAPAKAKPPEDPKDAALAVAAAPSAPAAPVVKEVPKPAAPVAVTTTPIAAPAAAPSKADPEKERLAKEKAARDAEIARKAAEAEKEKLAKEDKARQDQKAKEDKAKAEALAKAEKDKQDAAAKAEKDKQEALAKAEKAKQEAMAKAEKARQDSLARVAEQKAKDDKAKQEAIAKAKPAAKPFDIKAYQDSIYKAELEKRLSALHLKNGEAAAAPGVPVAVVPPVAAVPSAAVAAKPDAAKEKEAKEAEAKQQAEKEKLAKEEKARQEQKAKEDKAKQEAMAKAEKARQDSVAKVAEMKAKDEKAKQEAMAKADKARQDSLAKVADQKAKDAKAKQEAMAKAEKARQDSVAKVAEQKAKDDKAKQEAMAKAEKSRQDSVAKVAEQKARDDKAKQEAMAKAEKARQDSLARVAELKAKEEKAKQEAIARAEKARQDSLVRVAEMKAKVEKARQDSLARVAEQKAKEDKARLERERLAKERKDRFDRAYALYREGRNDTAAVVFKAVLADSPVADAWYYAGRTHLAKRDYSRAYDLFGKSPGDKPDLDGLKGKALMGMGKNKEALKAIETQYAKSKDDSLLEDLVVLKRKLGDEPGAIAALEILAEKRPGVLKYQEELAGYWRSKGNNPKASERYSRVFIIDPLNGEANYWLGMEASKTPEQMRAVSMLERATVAFPTRADAWKALAKGNLALGRKDAAWESHRKAIALLPNDLELAKGRLSLARESHPAELASAHEAVLRIAPGDLDAAMGLAKLRFQQGDFAGAEKNFRVACKDSKDAHAWAEFGRSLLELKKTDEAATALQKAVDLGEKDPSLRLDLARIRMDKGDLDWAEALLKDLNKKAPADPDPLYYLGQIALKRQQTAVAEEFFRKAHQLKPEDGRGAEALARLLRDKDEWKAAAAVLAQADGKLSPSGKLLYGDCLARSGEQIKAQEVYGALYQQQASAPLLARRMDLLTRMGKAGQAVELASGSPFQENSEVKFSLAKAQLDLAEAHVLKGDVDQAVDLMKQVVKTDDHKPEFHYYLGLGYFDQNRFKKALDEFAEALTYRVDYPDALYRKGLCLVKTGDIKEAENSFGELSQHADAAWKARGLYGLALVFEAQGKPEAVQHHLERSIAAAPSADAMSHLSRISLAQSKIPEAQDWARKALVADPGNEIATVALGDALAAGKKQSEAMELARAGLKAKPLSCNFLVQSAKLNFQAGKMDSTLAASSVAIKACPEEPMAYFYAGVATHSSNRPKEAKQYFKTFRKLGGDEKLVPGN